MFISFLYGFRQNIIPFYLITILPLSLRIITILINSFDTAAYFVYVGCEFGIRSYRSQLFLSALGLFIPLTF